LASRSGTGAGLGFGAAASDKQPASPTAAAGFGILKRSGTPEPWVRRLADDGMSYYYWNKLNGEVRWTLPEANSEPPIPNGKPRRANIPTPGDRDTIVATNGFHPPQRQRTQSMSDRHSGHSDDSEIDPRGRSTSISNSQSSLNGDAFDTTNLPAHRYPPNNMPVVELTSAERSAQSLQRALAPPPPELITELSEKVQRSITAVVDNIQSVAFPRRPEEDSAMNELVGEVVIAVRNLLYVSATPSGHIPSDLIPGGGRDPGVKTASQALLKPAQRKVTATLSKLVLSARAVLYDSGSSTSDIPTRIEGDAEELERAVLTFVMEVQRSQNQAMVEQLTGTSSLKRLHGVFLTANIGLGLVGGGAAANWKGFGWVAVEDTDESLGRILGTDVITELDAHLKQVEDTFVALAKALRSLTDESGEYRVLPLNVVHALTRNDQVNVYAWGAKMF
jgi:son of sevenless